MAQSSVIREFLVKLGYKVDQQAIDKFKADLEKTTKVIVGMGLAIEATAVAVATGVAKFASNLESLYFASVRTGTAAASLKAFDRAAQGFGTSAGQALNAAEALARFMRQNPAGSSYINALLGQVGESAFDQAGKLKDIPELMLSLGKLFQSNLRRGAGFQNYQISELLGIDEKTMLAITNGTFAREYERIRRELNSPTFQRAVEGSHRFMNSLRNLQTVLFELGVQIVDTLQVKFGLSLDKLRGYLEGKGGQELVRIVSETVAFLLTEFNKLLDWWQGNHSGIEATIRGTWDALKNAYTSVIKPVFMWLFGALKDLDTQTGGLSSKVLLLTTLLSKMGLPTTVAGISAIAIALGDVKTNAQGTESVLSSIVESIKAMIFFVEKIADNPITRLMGQYTEWWSGVAGSFGSWLGGKFFSSDTRETWAQRLSKYGFTTSQQAGVFANIIGESAGNPAAVNRGKDGLHYGLFQMGPTWQARYTQWADRKNAEAGTQKYDRWLNYALGDKGIDEQLEFFKDQLLTNPELKPLLAVMNANRVNGALGSNAIAQAMMAMFEKPYNPGTEKFAEEAARRGAMSISFFNTYHIDNKDPKEVARQIDQRLKDQHAKAAREFAAVGIQ